MNRIYPVLYAGFLYISVNSFSQTEFNEKIWLTHSGDTSLNWESQVFHLGNSYFGASCYGGPEQEIFTLAEKTFWTGGPGDNQENDYGIIPYADKSVLDQIKKNTSEGNIREVDKIAGIFNSKWSSAFSCIGKLKLDFQKRNGNVEEYCRTLDLDKSVCTIKYTIDNIHFTREYFCSYPARILAMRITADKPGELCFDISFNLYHKKGNPVIIVDEKNGTYDVHGNIDDNNRPYVVRIKAANEGGGLYKNGENLSFRKCNTVIIYYTVATNYLLQPPLYKGADPDQITSACISEALQTGYGKLREAHVKDYQTLYKRSRLSLENKADERINLPTNERLDYYIEKKDYDDLGLKELAFNFGKYFLISCSRPGTQIAGLYGIWNNMYAARWNGVVQLDMNVLQTYMFGNALNLSECQRPIIDWIKDKAISGEKLAREYFDSEGWMSDMIGDIWGSAGLLDENSYKFNSTGWLALILYEQYAFDRNKEYLEEIYPVLKGAAQFYLNNLIEYKNTGCLVAYGFASAEHASPEGSLMPNYQDIGFAAETFDNTVTAARTLGVDIDFQKKLLEAKDKLMPYKIGRWKQFQEWVEDLDDQNCQHRHMSHLLPLQPCHQINVLKNPEYLEAIKTTLRSRGDADFIALKHPELGNSNLFPSKCTHEGFHFDNYTAQVWCRASRICAWLNVFDGNHADKIYNDIFRESTLENMMQYETMLHYQDSTQTPCFPDGVVLSAGYVTEMVLQSRFDELYLLPALPDSWQTGSITGIRGRGGFTVDLYWEHSKLVKAVIAADNSGNCRIRYKDKVKTFFIDEARPLVITSTL